MPRALLFSAVAVASLAFILVQRRGSRAAQLAIKPIPMLLLMAGLYLCGEAADPAARTLLALGLVASLVGDVCLAMPGDRFLAGLASFLVAHLLYVAAFLHGVPREYLLGAIPWGIPYFVAGAALFAWLRPGLGKMQVPTALYALAICVMCLAACARGLADRSLLAPLGASLFFASDGILATDRFRRPFPAAKPLLYALYAGGQALLTASAWAQPIA